MKIKEPIIQFVGLKDLSDAEQEVVKKISFEYQDKIQRSMETPTSLVVTVKLHESGLNKRKKYSLRIHTLGARKTLETKHSHDWDLARALHKAFKNMERVVLHEFKADSQNKKLASKKHFLKQLGTSRY